LLGFSLRIFLSFFGFIAAILVGSAAAYSEVRLDMLGTQAVSVLGEAEDGFFQLRIEQRVIIRVPRDSSVTISRMQMGKASSRGIAYKEKKVGKCLMMDRFIASRPGSGSKENLELITRSGDLIRVYLGDGCLAREFYAGAYMERAEDGKLCADRDMIHARTGAKCDIDKFRLLVAK
jgi:hypothetical protein